MYSPRACATGKLAADTSARAYLDDAERIRDRRSPLLLQEPLQVRPVLRRFCQLRVQLVRVQHLGKRHCARARERVREHGGASAGSEAHRVCRRCGAARYLAVLHMCQGCLAQCAAGTAESATRRQGRKKAQDDAAFAASLATAASRRPSERRLRVIQAHGAFRGGLSAKLVPTESQEPAPASDLY